MFRSLLAGFGFAAALSLSSLAHAGDMTPIEITNPSIKVLPNVGGATGGYLSLTNTGDTDDRLIAVSTEGAMMVQIHEMAMNDGVMEMRELDGGLPLPAGETVTLAPRGLHLMIMKSKQAFEPGQVVPMTLTFETAGDVQVEFTVKSLGDILQQK